MRRRVSINSRCNAKVGQKILITGGCGYIGSHVARLFLEEGHEVAVVDNLSTSDGSVLDKLQGVRAYICDLRDTQSLDRIFDTFRPTSVVHFAGSAYVGESFKRPLNYFENNVQSTVSLASIALKYRVMDFIFSSTCAVYKPLSGELLTEESEIGPVSPYGASKLFCEEILKWISNIGSIRVVILRYFNAAGASSRGDIGEDHDPETHLIPLAVLATDRSRSMPLTVFGVDFETTDGTCERDFVHVEDLAIGHRKALEWMQTKDAGVFDVFNLGSGRSASVLEVVKSLERISGKHVDLRYGKRRPGDPASVRADVSKAKNTFSWTPSKTLDDIIASAFQYHGTRAFRDSA